MTTEHYVSNVEIPSAFFKSKNHNYEEIPLSCNAISQSFTPHIVVLRAFEIDSKLHSTTSASRRTHLIKHVLFRK
jgi:hypothetical protein